MTSHAKQPLVSIIVPVYNTSLYLDECLNSLVNQTLKDIEIVCVNDASTDNSLEILQDWAGKDERIKVINSLVNHKLGFARNLGVKAASGTYIGFVDSDDYVSTEFYQSLIDSISLSDKNAEVATARYYMRFGMIDAPVRQISTIESQNSIKRWIAVYGCRLWMSIFKRSYLLENNLLLPEDVVYDDNAIVLCMFLLANRIVVVDNKWPLYFYRIHDKSIVHGTFTDIKLSDRLTTAKMMMNNMEKYHLRDLYSAEFDSWFYRTFYHNTLFLLMTQSKRYKCESVRKVYQEYKNIVGNFPQNNYMKRIRHVWLYKFVGKFPLVGYLIRIRRIFG